MRVFISSTFRDMAQERDELVKQVFPQLRERCESRGVTWGEVDLRWGVTDEQAAEGRVLPICLEEIQACRPYFIALLGVRYGWVPDQIDDDLIGREPWLSEHLRASVTELEIVHGVLRDPAMAEHAFFYFRDPAYSAGRGREFLELPTAAEVQRFGATAAEERARRRRERLAALKDEIRASGLPVRESYVDPRELGRLVLEDLTGVIERVFPAGSRPSPLQRERALHEAYARSRIGVHIGRSAYFERLDAHASTDGAPLVLLGESGVGKSALLANWSERLAQPVVTHFVASSPLSADWVAMLRRLIGELADRLGLTLPIPDDLSALRAAFADALDAAHERGRVVLVIDALDQLEERDGGADLVWLPETIPSNVRLVVSTLPGSALAALAARDWQTLEVSTLSTHERRELIEEYLAQYTKALPEDQIRRIADAPQAANPLYLRAMLEELRLYGEHELLGARLSQLLWAADVPQLYRLILARWEEDYERDRPGIVGDSMRALWAARRGLSEAELLTLLGAGDQPLPRAHFSPLYLAAKQALIDRDGLLGFAHRYVREAVADRYLPDVDARLAAHRELAAFFVAPSPDLVGRAVELPRALEERPWQLARAHAWDELARLLSDPPIIASFQSATSELYRYWSEIEASSQLRMLDVLRPILDAPQTLHPSLLSLVAGLLSHAGHVEEAAALSDEVLEKSQPDTGALLVTDVQRSHALLSRAALRLTEGRYEEAWPMLKEAEAIVRATGSERGLAYALDGLAMVHMKRGEHDEALSLLQETERAWRGMHDEDGLQTSLGNQALILQERGELDAALALHREEERICRGQGDLDGLRISLNNQATIHERRGELSEARKALKQTERIARDLGQPRGLERSLRHQVAVIDRQLALVRRDVEAVSLLLREKQKIGHALGDHGLAAAALLDQAASLLERGDAAAAIALTSQALEVAREHGLGDAESRSALLLAIARSHRA